MKPETKANKLNEMLGLKVKAVEVENKYSGMSRGISEEEIQEFRVIQGVLYFLQAPQLFTSKICPNCNTPFLVSRKFVAVCSYACLAESLREQGLKFSKGNDLEALALDPQVYNGNEPIWIRGPVLDSIKEIVASLSKTSTIEESPAPSAEVPKLKPESSSAQVPTVDSTETTTPSSPAPMPTGVGRKPSKKSSPRKSVRRIIHSDTQ